MDPLSHVLFGRTLDRLDVRRRFGPGALAAFVIGSVLPDVDTALVPFGMDVYLRYHQVGTHSLLFSVFQAGLLAAVLRRRVTGARFGSLFIAAWSGVLGHVFWDLADGSDMRIWAPFSDGRSGWHWVAMGDPFVVLPLVLGTIATWRRPDNGRVFGTAVIVALAAVLAVKHRTQHVAERLFVADGARSTPLRSEEVWGSLFRWRLYERRASELRVWEADGWSRDVRLLFERNALVEDGAVATSKELPIVRNFLRQAVVPFAWIEREGDRELVLWSDLLFCSARSCALTFGGAFDASQRPVSQFVLIGRHRLERELR